MGEVLNMSERSETTLVFQSHQSRTTTASRSRDVERKLNGDWSNLNLAVRVFFFFGNTWLLLERVGLKQDRYWLTANHVMHFYFFF